MRIIAGSLKGRLFNSPHGHRTHPMSDKVRGALFNMLGDIEGLSVLDAFAGSGALSFEAISRGASKAVAIDLDKNAHRALVENIQLLDTGDQVKAIFANASAWSQNNPDAKFDLVFAAPPYDNLQLNLIKKLTRHVVSQGLYVLDWPGRLEVPRLPELELIEDKKYGDARLGFYRAYNK